MKLFQEIIFKKLCPPHLLPLKKNTPKYYESEDWPQLRFQPKMEEIGRSVLTVSKNKSILAVEFGQFGTLNVIRDTTKTNQYVNKPTA